MKKSTSSRRKGGNIEWGHQWQQQLVSAIYTCQRCESQDELSACKKWIYDYIDLNPALSQYLRRQLRQFFTRKFQEERHWVHLFRIAIRQLSIKSSSRIEGEFGAVWLLKLHANTTLRLAFEKLRWAAQRRRRHRLNEVESLFSKWVKRKSAVVTDEEDWQFLIKQMTSFYRKKIESALSQVPKYSNQLIRTSVNELVFAVWRVDYDDSDSDMEDEDSCDDCSSDTSSGGINEGEAEVENGPDAVAVDADAPDAPEHTRSDKEWSAELTAFKWRRVRIVKLVRSPEQKKYFVCCSCQRCEGTCVPCVHQFNGMLIFGPLRLRDLAWHPRVTSAYYYNAVVREHEFHPDAVRMRVLPHLAEVVVDEWRNDNDRNASTVGVPLEGLLDSNFELALHHEHNDDVPNDPSDGGRKKSARVSR